MTAQLMILSTAAVVSVTDSMRWGVVLDCGSSGTRVHIYNWDHDVGLESLAEFTPTKKEDQDLLIDNIKGISSFADVPAGVAPYITSLLDQAARWVPSAKQSTTRVHAYATAGMRLLTEARQQPIWQNIDDAMLASGFRYEVGDSATIGGEYEGIFNYLALRHILRSAPAGTPPILGGLDLGGASTQITFAPSSGVILNDAYRLVVNYTAMRLYSHSFMRFGQNEAMQRYAQSLSDAEGSSALYASLNSPCHNRGLNETFTVDCSGGTGNCVRLLNGTGDYTACRSYASSLLGLQALCLLGPCSANGIYQPNPSAVAFYAVSSFFYTANGLGLIGWNEVKGIPTSAFEAAGHSFCGQPWVSVQSEYSASYCFLSAYVPALLDSYAIDRDSATAVTYARKIAGFSMGWALGAQIFLMAEQACTIEPAGKPPNAGNPTDCTAAEQPYEIGLGLGVPAALALGGALGGVLGHRRALKERNREPNALLPGVSDVRDGLQ